MEIHTRLGEIISPASRALFDQLDVAVVLLDSAQKIQFINTLAGSFLPLIPGSVIGVRFMDAMDSSLMADICKLNDPAGEMQLKDLCNSLSIPQTWTEIPFVSYVAVKKSPSSKELSRYFKLVAVPTTIGNQSLILVTLHDITEIVEKKLQLKKLADQDFLTGLANRRSFFDVGQSFFLTAQRGYIHIAVAMFDIDFFKKINDGFGHAAGDMVIKEVSSVLRSTLRESDIVARFGGEEFCVLLQCRENSDALAVIEKVRTAVEWHSFLYNGQTLRVTVSAGLTAALESTLDEMVNCADDMLYRAKHNGRNRTESYAPEYKNASNG